MKRISLRLYRVRIRSCQKSFSFDRFVQREVVLLVLVLVWLVLQVGLLLVWVWVSCCDVASWLHWVLPQCLVLREDVLLVWVLVSCCWCASLLCWVLPQCLCILVLIRGFRGQILRAEMFLVGVRLFLVHEMFLVWIVPLFVCFLRHTKIWVRDSRDSVFRYYETFRFQVLTSAVNTAVRRSGS